MKLYRCKKCGQIVEVIKDTGVPLVCCGETMEELTPKIIEEGLTEKHLPIYEIHDGSVTINVGSTLHPMLSNHYIEWILLVTNKGCQKVCLKPGKAPTVTFRLGYNEQIKAIYAFCNIHSLWITKVDCK